VEPILIHPVDVYVQNIDREETVVDPVFGEPTPTSGGVKYGSSFLVKAQVKYKRFKNMVGHAGGFDLEGDGYLLMYKKDAELINKKAKIVSIDDENVEYYVKEKKPASHYDSSKFRRVVFESLETGGG